VCSSDLYVLSVSNERRAGKIPVPGLLKPYVPSEQK
jgi:hypothetical protein